MENINIYPIIYDLIVNLHVVLCGINAYETHK